MNEYDFIKCQRSFSASYDFLLQQPSPGTTGMSTSLESLGSPGTPGTPGTPGMLKCLWCLSDLRILPGTPGIPGILTSLGSLGTTGTPGTPGTTGITHPPTHFFYTRKSSLFTPPKPHSAVILVWGGCFCYYLRHYGHRARNLHETQLLYP